MSPGQIIENIFFFIEYVQWKYIFSNNTTVCVLYVKPVSFLFHSITSVTNCSDDRSEVNLSWRRFTLKEIFAMIFFFGENLLLWITGKIPKIKSWYDPH